MSLTQRLVRLRTSACFAILASVAASTAASTLIASTQSRLSSTSRWSATERETLRSLVLASLAPIAADKSNRVGDDPRAAALGHALFFDKRLSANASVSCATCHLPERDFQDDKPLAEGVGRTARRTMPIAGTAHGPWFFWDGRTDSQWAQALGPLESAVEHGGTRTQYARVIARHYRDGYERVFGALPDLDALPERAAPAAAAASVEAWRRIPAARRDDITLVYANIGKAIAAYERRIEHAPSRFDRWAQAELAGRTHSETNAFTPNEEAGLRLFIGKANCVTCHNGPRFTDDHFHNTGVPASAIIATLDSGRAVGARQAVAGEFSCTSRWSDAKPDECDELHFAVTEGAELVRAYKTPSLRSVAERAPYMHAGQLVTLSDVVAHYDRASAAPFGHSELKPLRLSALERRQIEAFLRTLSAPVSAPSGWLDDPFARSRSTIR